jgi:hypothetical protein
MSTDLARSRLLEYFVNSLRQSSPIPMRIYKRALVNFEKLAGQLGVER